ncbi:MAG TPA: tyrosine--tRNA ligase [Methanomassiliicoccales archaeon]|nr:tyrosine--tRNA ligase [Methanomassiliicoccales archaeon]
MDAQARYELVAGNAEEIVTPEELRELLSQKSYPRAYVGFEPSGLVHAGWMIVASKITDFVKADFHFIVFFADWHAYINDKFGGDIEKIRACARYMEDCFEALGVPRDKVEFEFASKLMDDIDYWEKLINIAKASSLMRVKRAMTIMGRTEDEVEVDSSKVLYPLMQASDIFAMDLDVAYAGMDQRRAHMLAREAADKLGWRKPVAVHTPLLPSLKGANRMDPAAGKMSKSDPDSGILIHDSPEDIKRKISKAFCPPEAEGNPIIDIAKFVVFPRVRSMKIDRPAKFGGPLEFKGYDELVQTYAAGKLHPMDLKAGVAQSMADVLEPVRDYFKQHPQNLKALQEIIAGK